MKLWQVTENDMQIRFFWYETKKEAKEHARQCREEMIRDGEFYTVDIETVEFGATRKGLVKAMNFVIGLTCFNEG